jgi:hypothetical protein
MKIWQNFANEKRKHGLQDKGERLRFTSQKEEKLRVQAKLRVQFSEQIFFSSEQKPF